MRVFYQRQKHRFVFRNTTAGNIYITAHAQPTRNNAAVGAVIRMYGQDLGDGVSYKLRSEVERFLNSQGKIYENDKYVT